MFCVPKGGTCYACRSSTEKHVRQEDQLKSKLLEWEMHWSSNDSAIPCAARGCKKRPDFVFFTKGWVIVLECDEGYHRYYEVSCEISRIGILKDQLKLPMLLVRFNPDKADYAVLERVLRQHMSSDALDLATNEYGVHIIYIGYPEDRVQELNEHAEDMCGMPFPCTEL